MTTKQKKITKELFEAYVALQRSVEINMAKQQLVADRLGCSLHEVVRLQANYAKLEAEFTKTEN